MSHRSKKEGSVSPNCKLIKHTQSLVITRRESSGFERVEGNKKAPAYSEYHVVGRAVTSGSRPLDGHSLRCHGIIVSIT
jgi:hypothetical protein